jgi:hypothetical protein
LSIFDVLEKIGSFVDTLVADEALDVLLARVQQLDVVIEADFGPKLYPGSVYVSMREMKHSRLCRILDR